MRYTHALAAAGALCLTLVPRAALAHCDTLDGPVVKDARAALDTKDVTPVLKWVRVDKEGEIREAFQHALGVRTLELLDRLAAEGVRPKLLYTISSFQNPTGATLSLDRRQRLLHLAARHGFLILDDEAYADLYYDAEPLPSLLALSAGHGVISVGTFSKTVATGLRMGWIMARPRFIQMFTRMRFDMGQNQMGLRMMSNFLASGVLEPHLATVRALYRDKMNRLADALLREAGEYLHFERPRGGFYLWVALRDGLSAQALWRAAAEEGVSINPGAGFRSADEPAGEYLRIAFAWTPLDAIEEAARRIGIACRRAASGDVP